MGFGLEFCRCDSIEGWLMGREAVRCVAFATVWSKCKFFGLCEIWVECRREWDIIKKVSVCVCTYTSIVGSL